MWPEFGPEQLWALVSVMMIDLVLAGDNALVVGIAASGLEPRQRRQAILWGIGIATALRIAFAGAALHLLEIIGLTLAGGILLLWVAWKLFREIYAMRRNGAAAAGSGGAPRKTLLQACLQIALADVSMSLDNVLAVAGAAREHPAVLIFGLSLSVLLMGVAARGIASLLHKFRWLAYIGLAVILYVAFGMIVRGAKELEPVFSALVGYLAT
jgi:YjbE family integral membrane protein